MAVIPVPERLLHPMEFPRKLLMGPGPANAPPRVLAAGALPLLGHLHPEFVQIMDDCKSGIQYAFQTENPVTLAISGTGHAAMEAACCNLVEAGDVVLVLCAGIWGHRFADMVDRHDGVVKKLNKPAGETFSLSDIEQGLRAHNPKLLFVTHGESSSTTLQSLEGIGKLCHKFGCLVVVDSVAALGGVPLLQDAWELDVVYTGGQKVLSCPPGASPISFGPAAMKKVKSRKTKIRSFYLDINELANYWGCDGQPRRYHHTGPISNIYTLREALSILAEETLAKCWERHAKCAALLHDGLRQLGLELFVKNPECRLPTVTGIVVPPGVDWKKVADNAMAKYRVEISGGLGATAGKIWRVGLLGYNAEPENVKSVLSALKEGITLQKKSHL
ncbi:hypothetical protein CAPTEDRAFT_164164 [Capitella teleta]|uniref:Alanine--glyoxylate aminotransferase n=1 Tax=Capitella teleta TaxID=283909 RepID=R7UG84_CAPTE|nr:hypothetical protein CAPTEDRAFT_164164 [Capitella teleta]|eukprot:ELU05539.1 hypothetical protein CAPTEDRAFT_164164 [Capitella teleta]